MAQLRKTRIVVSVSSILLACFLIPVESISTAGSELQSGRIHMFAEFTGAEIVLIALGMWVYPKPVIWFEVLKIYVITSFAVVAATWIISYFAY
jgi:hypothetical protein